MCDSGIGLCGGGEGVVWVWEYGCGLLYSMGTGGGSGSVVGGVCVAVDVVS